MVVNGNMMENNQQLNNVMSVTVDGTTFLSAIKFVNPIVNSSVDGKLKILIQRTEVVDVTSNSTVSMLRISAGGIKSSLTLMDIPVKGISGSSNAYVDGKELIDTITKLPEGDIGLEFDHNKEIIKIYCEGNVTGVSCEIMHIEVEGKELSEKELALLRYRNALLEEVRRDTREVESLGKFSMAQKDFVDIVKALEKCPYTIDGENYIKLRMFVGSREVPKADSNEQGGAVENVIEYYAAIEGTSEDGLRISKIVREGYNIGYPPNAQEITMLVNTKILNDVAEAIKAVKSIELFKDEPLIISRGPQEMCIRIGVAKFMCEVKDFAVGYGLHKFNYGYAWSAVVGLEDFKRRMSLMNTSLGSAKDVLVDERNIAKIVPKEKAIRLEGISAKGVPVSLSVKYEMSPNFNDVDVINNNPNAELPFMITRKSLKDALDAIESKKGKLVQLGIHVYTETVNATQKGEDGRIKRDEANNAIVVQQEITRTLLSIADATLGDYGVHQRMEIEFVE